MRDLCSLARIAGVAALAVVCAEAALAFGQITARNGDLVTLSVGSRDGVKPGMRGEVVKAVDVEGQTQPAVIASFVVTEVGESSSRARLEKVAAGFESDPMEGLFVAFDTPLMREEAGPATPRTTPSPTARATQSPAPKVTPPSTATPGVPSDPVELLNEANAAWERQDWPSAAQLYEALLQAMPNYPVAVERAALARAKARAAQGGEDAARHADNEAARQAALAHERRDLPVYREKAKALLDVGNWSAAVEWLRKIAAVDLSDAFLVSVIDGRRHEAEQALAEKRYEDAISECDRALAVSASPAIEALRERARTEEVSGWLAEGDRDLARGDVRAARAAWDRVAAVEPQNAGLNERLTRLDWVQIPAGPFQMGCVPGDQECSENEKPRHAVTISRPFLMMIRPVTVAQYRRFAKATGRVTATVPELGPAFAQGDDHPVVDVTWNDAAAYCSWVGGRLPTEAEWEYAARGGKDGLKYPWGDSISHDDANFKGTGGRDRWKYTSPVGSFAANGFGLLDMVGNVWEWCADLYGESYYATSPSVDPPGPSSGSSRVMRGGSWNFEPKNLRISVRGWIVPWGGCDSGGFRCVRPTP